MSRSDKITATNKKELFYSDFFTNLDKHPLNGSLARVTNEEAVRQSVRNLIMTDTYERPYQSQLGSKLHSLLFEPMDELTVSLIERTVEDTIRLYEPRASLRYIKVVPVESRNEYTVNIVFSLINTIGDVQMNLTIKRIR
jgi:phage baseplate assembly protein W